MSIAGTFLALGSKLQGNITFTNGTKVLSICLDNGPAGTYRNDRTLRRADIRCFNGDNDVTGRVFGVMDHDTIPGDIENMGRAMNWLQLSSDPYNIGG